MKASSNMTMKTINAQTITFILLGALIFCSVADAGDQPVAPAAGAAQQLRLAFLPEGLNRRLLGAPHAGQDVGRSSSATLGTSLPASAHSLQTTGAAGNDDDEETGGSSSKVEVVPEGEDDDDNGSARTGDRSRGVGAAALQQAGQQMTLREAQQALKEAQQKVKEAQQALKQAQEAVQEAQKAAAQKARTSKQAGGMSNEAPVGASPH